MRRPSLGEERRDVYLEATEVLLKGSVIVRLGQDERRGKYMRAVQPSDNPSSIGGVTLRTVTKGGRTWVRYYGAATARIVNK